MTEGAYEKEIKGDYMEILKTVSPYVLSEARWGFADIMMYLPEDASSLKVQQDLYYKKNFNLSNCQHYYKNICWLKRREWGDRYKNPDAPHYEFELDENQDKTDLDNTRIWYNRRTDETIERERGDCFWDIPELVGKSKCDGKQCEHFLKVLKEKKKATKTFDEGLHLFEIKSDHDQVERFGYQIPHYCLFADFVWLIVENHNIPDWMPPFVGVINYSDGRFIIKRKAEQLDRFPYLNKGVIQNSESRCIDANRFLIYRFLREWFINSAFEYSIGKNIVKMDYLDKLIDLKEKTDRSGTEEFDAKTLDEYCKEMEK